MSRDVTPTTHPAVDQAGVSSQSHQQAEEFPSMIKISRPFLTKQQIAYMRNLSNIKGPTLDQLRSQGLMHMMGIAQHFKFPIKTVSTAMNLFQRFLLYNRLGSSNDLVVACMLVASKVEDTPKKALDLLQCSFNLRKLGEVTDDNPKKRGILGLERQILETIGFDFRIRHSHHYIVPISKTAGEKVTHDVARTAWAIATDALLTDVILRFPAHSIAFGCIVLAAKVEDVDIFPIEPTNYCTNRTSVTSILVELVDYYIRSSMKGTELGQYWREVGKLFTWREKFSKELKADNDDERELTGLKMRDPKFDRQGSIRYVLDWEKDHVAGETIS